METEPVADCERRLTINGSVEYVGNSIRADLRNLIRLDPESCRVMVPTRTYGCTSVPVSSGTSFTRTCPLNVRYSHSLPRLPGSVHALIRVHIVKVQEHTDESRRHASAFRTIYTKEMISFISQPARNRLLTCRSSCSEALLEQREGLRLL